MTTITAGLRCHLFREGVKTPSLLMREGNKVEQGPKGLKGPKGRVGALLALLRAPQHPANGRENF
jgi:hypothetical protein